MTDFSTPRRMSVSAFVVILYNTLRRSFGVAVFIIVLNVFNSDSGKGLLTRLLLLLAFIMGIIVIAAIWAFLEYTTKKFYISGGNLIFMHGVLRRETATIPLDRIHAMRTKRGIIYRLFQLRGITFDTLASKTEEIELILDEADWQQLLFLIDTEEHVASAAPSVQPACSPDNSIKFCNRNLFKGAICQNHLKGLLILSGLIGALYGRISDISDTAASEIAVYAAERSESLLHYAWGIPAAIIIVYLIILILWIGKVMLRYYDMTLTVGKKLLSFESGMFSRFSSRFSYSKVCTIWVKRNFAERLLHCSTIMIKQALNATAKNEDDKLKIYGSDSSELFLHWWLGGDYSREREIISAKSGRGLFFYTILPDLILSGAATIVIIHFQLFWWLILPGIYILLSVFKGICAVRRSRICLRETYIVVNNGRFADIENYLKYDNIEVVRIRRTPLTKIFHRVTLEFSTSGSILSIRSLAEKEASFIYELLLLKSSNTYQFIPYG